MIVNFTFIIYLFQLVIGRIVSIKQLEVFISLLDSLFLQTALEIVYYLNYSMKRNLEVTL